LNDGVLVGQIPEHEIRVETFLHDARAVSESERMRGLACGSGEGLVGAHAVEANGEGEGQR
jgi:hypothetical protein